MIDYNYWCPNSECPNPDKKHRFVIRKSEDDTSDELCSFCNNPLKRIGQKLSGGYLKIGSMTPSERKQVLKKRSNEHFEKEIKQKKEYIDKNLL